MKLHFSGVFSGNPIDLPNQRQVPDAVPFKEPTGEKFPIIANALSLGIFLLATGLAFLRTGNLSFINIFGLVAAVISLFPHEFLHALCFREDVYFYLYFKKGMMFVVGSEDMSKSHFVIMSLLPNIIFGFIPFSLFMIFPKLSFWGSLGALAIGFGAGDYINVFNALTQMPKGAVAYMYQMETYWHKKQ